MQLNYKKNVQINKKKRKSEGARRSEAPDRRSKSRKESGEGASAEGSPKGTRTLKIPLKTWSVVHANCMSACLQQ